VPLSAFHPAVRAWFAAQVGTPTPPQVRGWPVIRSGANALIAAPTGSGKTLAAFLCAIDALVQEGPYLADVCRVLYVSPLRALSNDVQKNLLHPLAGIAALDAFVPSVRVVVRTGDTTPAERQQMVRKPPHILVTTPESLGILLTTASGRGMLSTVRTVIIDEIHAVAGSKRGSHLSLSLERLARLVGESAARPLQRIGLSATQKPLDHIAAFLVGRDRTCDIVDIGHLRQLDLGVEIPSSPLAAVCSHEVWDEVYGRMVDLIVAHRTTVIFVNTRKMAERISLRLIERFSQSPEVRESGSPEVEDRNAFDDLRTSGLPDLRTPQPSVACHHGSLSKERRLDAEQRLKAGSLRALVATGTLELGIDIGAVDLVIQIGSPRAIGTFLQRVGRAGHGVGRTPKARIFALTSDELIESAALLRAVREGVLDAIRIPQHPWDVLAQHIVAVCVNEALTIADLQALLSRSDPYRQVDREQMARVVALHAHGRFALLHYDPMTGVVRATRRARLTAVMSGGAIPDTALYQVREEPGDVLIGTIDEDFSLESSPGDIFQLGNTAWRILAVEGRAGIVRVANAHGAPPTIPFWLGEAPGRTRELSEAVGRLRADADGMAWLQRECGLTPAAAASAWEYLQAARVALGCLPTNRCVVAERFFDESGGQQLVIHAPFGTRVNRAWGLALRKRFCVGFGFELEAAATEEAILLSLSPTTSFPLAEVFAYLSAPTLRATLIQACLTGGQFETRWRWASGIALLVERASAGKKTPPFLLRIRANDALAAAFPQALACPDNLPPGKITIPEDHPIVAQVVDDCLTDLLDLDGLVQVITAIKAGEIAVHSVETAEPSPLALSTLAARPYAFLDDTPFEERRTRAVAPTSQVVIPAMPASGLDGEAVRLVRAQAWPDPRDAEECHEVLTWIGFVTDTEAEAWRGWLQVLRVAGRAELVDDRWYAMGSTRDAVACWRGRLEALGPVISDDPALLALEHEGVAMRVTVDGVSQWCHRRLLQRILRLGRERDRAAIATVSAADFWYFLTQWQGVAPDQQRQGPGSVVEALTQLTALELPAAAWVSEVLPRRIAQFKPEWIDAATMSGEFAWGRLWAAPALDPEASAGAMIRTTPIALIPRSELNQWLRCAGPAGEAGLSGPAREVLAVLRSGGALFLADVRSRIRQLPSTVEEAMGELIAAGLITCDSFAGLRWLLLPSDRRARARPPVGRWTLFRPATDTLKADSREDEETALLVARTLLRRTGVVFRSLYDRERIACPWRTVVRALRMLELRGEVMGGRFVSGFGGEQYALAEAWSKLSRQRGANGPVIEVSAADPLNYTGILVPGPRVRATQQNRVRIGESAPVAEAQRRRGAEGESVA